MLARGLCWSDRLGGLQGLMMEAFLSNTCVSSLLDSAEIGVRLIQCQRRSLDECGVWQIERRERGIGDCPLFSPQSSRWFVLFGRCVIPPEPMLVHPAPMLLSNRQTVGPMSGRRAGNPCLL